MGHSCVGYQKFELQDNFNFTAATFQRVDGQEMTLGDIVPDFGYGSSSIQLLDDGGACQKVEGGDFDGSDAQYYYVSAEEAEGIGVDAGWYLTDDDSFTACQNSRSLPFGQAFLLDCQDSGASLTYAGAVRTTDLAVELQDNFNFTANVAPKAMTLGDIVPDFGYGSSSIQLLDDGGACQKVEGGDFDGSDAQYYYVSAEEAEGIGVDAGWYLTDDDSFTACQNETPLAAGQGFLLDCQDSGATVTLPSAL